MIFTASAARGLTIQARDGAIGSIDDFYFDDAHWAIRYAVVDTGTWLSSRKVLIAPAALATPDFARGVLSVALTKDQVKNSPDIDTDKPVSRQQETSLHDYYGWAPYWGGGLVPGMLPLATAPGYGAAAAPGLSRAPADPVAAEIEAREREEADPHLRSAHAVTGYSIKARDGEIGHVEDFLISDEDWAIRYMVVDTRNWLPGKKVLVSPRWIEDISFVDRMVRVDLTQAQVKDSPEYDPARALARADEARLFNYYGRAPYW